MNLSFSSSDIPLIHIATLLTEQRSLSLVSATDRSSTMLLKAWLTSVVLSNMSLHGAFKATSLLSMLLFFSFCVCLSYCINIHCIGSKGGTRCGFTPPPFFPLFQGKALPCVWLVCFGEGLFPSFLHSVWLRIQVHWFFHVALAQKSKSFGKS